MRIVRVAPKPSLREASCCRVEVVNAGCGLRRTVLRSTAATVKDCAASSSRAAAPAAAASPRSNLSSLPPFRWVSRAVKGSSDGPVRRASTLQYSRERKASISASRSQMSRSATDWTRPAERLPGSLRQSTGESVKPTR